METHSYFENVRPAKHPEVSRQQAEWVARHPEYEEVQENGRFRRWAYVEDLNHYVRVIVLPDRETLFNAFIDSGFTPEEV
ncbi:MAG: hypothetical protein BRD38_02880 [Bacteroidetes bacterium QH_9_67_14]|nr:MAG: hypothetical protein BRD38_02880 [Bacteroidetes bacterium QH_9_67_14]